MLHGQKDTTVPYKRGSQPAFAELTTVPHGLVSYPEGSHVSVVFGADASSSEDAIIDFLDLELRHDPTGWNTLDGDLAKKGAGSLQVAGGLPKPTS